MNICVGTTCTVRHHIAALDPAGGALDTSWAPNVNSDLGVFAEADTTTGLAIGCVNAWHWVTKEDKAMRDEREDGDE